MGRTKRKVKRRYKSGRRTNMKEMEDGVEEGETDVAERGGG